MLGVFSADGAESLLQSSVIEMSPTVLSESHCRPVAMQDAWRMRVHLNQFISLFRLQVIHSRNINEPVY
jgi:hypothetical protein